MYFKKLLAGVATAALVSFVFVLPVSAHGHHGHYARLHHKPTIQSAPLKGVRKKGVMNMMDATTVAMTMQMVIVTVPALQFHEEDMADIIVIADFSNILH